MAQPLYGLPTRRSELSIPLTPMDMNSSEISRAPKCSDKSQCSWIKQKSWQMNLKEQKHTQSLTSSPDSCRYKNECEKLDKSCWRHGLDSSIELSSRQSSSNSRGLRHRLVSSIELHSRLNSSNSRGLRHGLVISIELSSRPSCSNSRGLIGRTVDVLSALVSKIAVYLKR